MKGAEEDKALFTTKVTPSADIFNTYITSSLKDIEFHYTPSIFRVSGSDEASSDEEAGEGAEKDDSFIDDRSQVTPSAAGTTPSAGTEASPEDMMALYR
jgi:hypothetical protein